MAHAIGVRRPSRRSRPIPLIVSALAVAAIAIPAIGATSANADTYGVIQCGDVYGNGGPARNGVYPFKDGSSGFQPWAHYGQGGRLDDCASDNGTPYGRGLVATLTGTWGQAAANGAAWRFNAAPDTKVTRYGARFRVGGRGFDGASGTSADVAIWHEGQSDPIYDFRDNRLVGPGLGAEQTIDKSIAGGAGYVIFNVGCGAVDITRTCPAGPTDIGQMIVQGYQAVINDDSNPQVSNVSGDLATAGTWRGTLSVSAQITDKGSGVYDLIFQKRKDDGTWEDLSSQILNTNGGKCVPVADAKVFTETRVFAAAQPCRTDASGDLDVDTSKLPEGSGTYRVLVGDAAGNRSTLIGANTRTVRQGPDPVQPPPPVIVANPDAQGGGIPVNPGATAISTPVAVSPTGVPATEAATKLLACSKQRVLLTEVYPSGGKVILRGVASSTLIGQQVAIRSLGEKGKIVAKAKVQTNGAFSVVAKAPKNKKLARSSKARYQAAVGPNKSLALKLQRRMYTFEAYRTQGGSLYVAGTLTKPFPKNAKVQISMRVNCSTWKTVKVTRASSSGKWGTIVPISSNATSLVFRAQSNVKKSARSKRTTRTYTLPSALQLR